MHVSIVIFFVNYLHITKGLELSPLMYQQLEVLLL